MTLGIAKVLRKTTLRTVACCGHGTELCDHKRFVIIMQHAYEFISRSRVVTYPLNVQICTKYIHQLIELIRVTREEVLVVDVGIKCICSTRRPVRIKCTVLPFTRSSLKQGEPLPAKESS